MDESTNLLRRGGIFETFPYILLKFKHFFFSYFGPFPLVLIIQIYIFDIFLMKNMFTNNDVTLHISVMFSEIQTLCSTSDQMFCFLSVYNNLIKYKRSQPLTTDNTLQQDFKKDKKPKFERTIINQSDIDLSINLLQHCKIKVFNFSFFKVSVYFESLEVENEICCCISKLLSALTK